MASHINPRQSDDTDFYDVIVIGGALSGGATATLLLRQNPGMRLLIVEKTAQLSRRVGEATVEVSAYFMGRVLGLTQYLNESHLVKQGLRFWFKNDEVKTSARRASSGAVSGCACRRISSIAPPSTKKCSVGRPWPARGDAAGDVTDAHLLRREQTDYGGEAMRPGRSHALGGRCFRRRGNTGAKERLVAAEHGASHRGGVVALERREGLGQPRAGREISRWSRPSVYGVRNTATNHVIGDGWWSWWIPLKGGDVSVGVVFDQRLVDWPQDGGKSASG